MLRNTHRIKHLSKINLSFKLQLTKRVKCMKRCLFNNLYLWIGVSFLKLIRKMHI